MERLARLVERRARVLVIVAMLLFAVSAMWGADVERTGRIAATAALLFAVAFGAFLTSRIVITKELGLASAIGVLLDATIIRAHRGARAGLTSDVLNEPDATAT